MKAQRTALVVVGLLLMLLGGGTATYVGPDDTLMIGSHTVGERARGQAVVTHPEITDFVNITLLVRADAPSGVFLGYAHHVDTTSLLEGRRHWIITRMALGNIGGEMVEGQGSSSERALRPDQIVGWLDSTSGDSVELNVPLDGKPIDVVAVPTAKDERVKVALGAKVERLFLSQLAVIGVGLVLIAFSFVLGWWVRRREARRESAAPTESAEGAEGAEAEPEAEPGSRTRTPARNEAGGLSLPKLTEAPRASEPESWEMALAAASVTKASTKAAVVERSVVAVATPSVVEDEVAEAVAVKDEDEVAEAVAVDPEVAVVPEVEVVPEPALTPTRRLFKRRFLFLLMLLPLARFFRRRVLSRRSMTLLLLPLAFFLQSCAVPGPAESNDDSLSRTGLSRTEAEQLVDDPVAVYAPEFTTYPMWALIATGDPNRLQLRTRADFTGKWRTRGKVRLAKASQLPDPVSSAIDPGPLLQERAFDAAVQVGSWWRTGDARGVAIDGRTKKARKKLLKSRPAAVSVTEAPVYTDSPVLMVEVSGGHLLWITHDLRTPSARYRLTTVALKGTTSDAKVLGSQLKKISRS